MDVSLPYCEIYRINKDYILTCELCKDKKVLSYNDKTDVAVCLD